MKKHTYGSFVDAKRNGDFEEYNMSEDPYAKKYSIPFMQGKWSYSKFYSFVSKIVNLIKNVKIFIQWFKNLKLKKSNFRFYR